MNKSVLITGASSGIGRALCVELDHHGCQVFAGVRKKEDADKLKSQASPKLTPVMLDLTQPETITQACHEVGERSGGELFCLVNNAAVDVSGALEFVPIEEFRHQMDVNVVGQLAVTQACLPLIRNGGGRIIFVSSVAGRMVTPFNGPYGASKAALVTMADALRMELAPWNIPVSALIIGSVQTPIWEKSAHLAGELLRNEPAQAREYYGKMLKQAGKFYREIGHKGMTAEELAKIIQGVIEAPKPKEYVFVGPYTVLIELMSKFLPIRIRDLVVRWQVGLLARRK